MAAAVQTLDISPVGRVEGDHVDPFAYRPGAKSERLDEPLPIQP